jgi:hypothetical protein
MALQLRRFEPRSIVFRAGDNDPDSPSKGPTMVFIGRRETGKSFLIKDILYHFRDVPVCTIISGTEAGNGFYGRIVPKLFIHEEYDTDIIGKVLLRQKKLTNQIKQEIQSYKRSALDARTIVALDDCLYDDKWTRDKLMRCLFLNGRHWKVMLLISMQYPLGIPPLMRTNVDYTFILRDSTEKCRRIIYENYASMFPSYEAFCSVMDQTTENYECLVINNNVKSNRLQDCVFWYKADAHPDFKLCKKEYWDLSEQLSGEGDADGEYDPAQHSTKKRKGTSIVVDKKRW